MCTRRRVSPPATTSDSPSSVARVITSSRESGTPSRGVSSASVQKRKRSSISSCSPEKGGRPCGDASIGTQAGSLPVSESIRPSRKNTNPCPPASTTWLRARTSSWRGVAASASRAATSPLCSSSGRSSSCARRVSSCDQARSTERMVPSRGSCRAEYADSVPLTAAAANCVPVDLAQPLHGGGEPVEELGEDRPGVAAGSVQGAVGGDAGGVAHRVGSCAPEPGRRRLERRRQVGARVRVAHREDVDAVQRLLLAHHRERARAHDAREHLSAEPGRVVDGVGHLQGFLPSPIPPCSLRTSPSRGSGAGWVTSGREGRPSS